MRDRAGQGGAEMAVVTVARLAFVSLAQAGLAMAFSPEMACTGGRPGGRQSSFAAGPCEVKAGAGCRPSALSFGAIASYMHLHGKSPCRAPCANRPDAWQ